METEISDVNSKFCKIIITGKIINIGLLIEDLSNDSNNCAESIMAVNRIDKVQCRIIFLIDSTITIKFTNEY